ncbi:hypothetical protein ACFX2K_003959 [Malus domestica]
MFRIMSMKENNVTEAKENTRTLVWNIRARAEMEPMSNVGEMEFERTPTITPIIPIAEHVQNNVNEGK